MSLFDYLNNDGSSSSANSMTSLLQQIAAQRGISIPESTLKALSDGTNPSSSNSSSSVTISVDAQRASAEATDAKKDAATLSKDLRAKLDKGGADAALSGFSGRALAVIALNDGGTFKGAEVAAAKTELRERDRQSAITFLNSGEVSASSLKAYGQQLLAARQSMSTEERRLRDNDPNLR